MKNFNLTSRESLVLRTFLPKQNVDDYEEGVYHKMSFLLFDIFDNEGIIILPNEMKGILGSLVKKGLIDVEETESEFIWMGAIFEDNQVLLDKVLSLAYEIK